jgi:hypothetical protein
VACGDERVRRDGDRLMQLPRRDEDRVGEVRGRITPRVVARVVLIAH